MEKINLIKKGLDKNQYPKIIDTKFSEFGIQSPLTSSIITNNDIENFFKIYENLFFNIPKEGELNSHRYLINKSSDYLGVISEIDVQPLLDEITKLRSELLQANQIIANFTTGSI